MTTTPAKTFGNADQSAKGILNAALAQYGLSDLAKWAWGQYTGGSSTDQILLDIRNQPEYKTRFPAMAALAAKGHAISETDYINYEKQASQLMQAAGLPAGFYDQPADFQALLENNVSVSELQERVQNAQTAIFTASPAVKQQIQQLYGVGASPGDVTAYFLDPDRAEPLLNRQLAAAKISGTGIDSGYGSLTKVEAEKAASVGLTDDAIRNGFQTLVQNKDTFNPQIGAHDLGEGGISREQQLGAAFEGDATAQGAIQREQATRKGEFGQGGQFAADKTGVTGLGSAAA